MNLALDIGNTQLKISVFDSEGRAEKFCRFDKTKQQELGLFIDSLGDIDGAIMLCSGEKPQALEEKLIEKAKKYIFLDDQTHVPITNCYLSPKTLGRDRLAAAVGAKARFKGKNVLIIDMGTAITLDLLSDKGEFLGGNISLGLNSRYRALKDYTFCLPLCEVPRKVSFPAKDSITAIESGVVLSVIYEIEGYVRNYSSKYKDLIVVLTGGDAKLVVDKLSFEFCLEDDLVARGLNEILEYNAD